MGALVPLWADSSEEKVRRFAGRMEEGGFSTCVQKEGKNWVARTGFEPANFREAVSYMREHGLKP